MGLIAMLRGEEPSPLDILFHYKNPGQYGEYATEFVLHSIPGYGKTVHNVYLSYKGYTTEIDVLLVHEKGIYVLESKNYSGKIFGSIDQQNWTQSLKNGTINPFYNPLKQNATHCRAIAEYLDVPSGRIISYIVFSPRCALKEIPDNTERYQIMRRTKLLKTLRRDLKKKDLVFTHQQVDFMTRRLQRAAHVSKRKKQAHIEAIKERTGGTTCPFCGERLVKRTGKYGLFYGCSSYPACQFTRSVN